MSFFDDALGAMGQSLEQSATKYVSGVTGPVVGGMLCSLFGGGQPSGGDDFAQLQAAITKNFADEKKDLDLLNGQMAAQTAAIEGIGTQLTAISSAIAVISSDIASMLALLQKLAAAEAYSTWQAVDNEMTDAITSIQASYSNLSENIRGYKAIRSIDIDSLVTTILDDPQGPAYSSALISTYVLPSGQRHGALELWSEMVSPIVAAGQLDYRQAVDEYFTYYKKLVSAQLLAANLLIEGHVYRKNGLAGETWALYKNQIKAQEDEFIQWLVPLVCAGVQAVWAKGLPPGALRCVGYDATMQLHAGFQAMPTDTGGDGYYSPSSIFEAAEELLAKFMVTAPQDRRILVHLLFADDQIGTFKEAIDAVPITIQPPTTSTADAAANSSALTPAHTGRFGPYVMPGGGQDTLDINFVARPDIYVYRQVYSPDAVDSPTYQLTDLNGLLAPVETYAGSTVSFQESKVLDYVLNVNAQKQFDFMNFAGYTVASPA
jgi:hypothetical protein